MRNTEQIKRSILNMLGDIGLNTANHRFTNDNLMISCPFSSITHESGEDKKPSFGIKITNRGFLWNCFTCNYRGNNLIDLMNTLKDEGIKLNGISSFDAQNSLRLRFPDFYENWEKEEREKQNLELPKKSLSNPDFIRYNVEKRGLTIETIETMDLRYNKKLEITMFPVYDVNNVLVGSVHHNIMGKKPKYYNDVDAGEYLYLEWLIKGKTGIVVEGMYDAVKVYQFLNELDVLDIYSVVGMFGAQVTKRQTDRLVSNFDSLLLMGDNDEAGIKMEENIYRMVKKKMPLVGRINYDAHDPDGIRGTKRFGKYLNNIRLFKTISTVNAKYYS